MIENGLNYYLSEAFRAGASDLHITAGLPPMVRIDGRVGALNYPKLTPTITRDLVYDILTSD